MVANMKVGKMDGYCVGEPWNAVAVDQDIGFTAHHDAGHLDSTTPRRRWWSTSSSPRRKHGRAQGRDGRDAEGEQVARRPRQPRQGGVHARRARVRERDRGRRSRGGWPASTTSAPASAPRTSRTTHGVLPRRPGQRPAPVARDLVPGPVPAPRLAHRRRPTTRSSPTRSCCATSTRRSPRRRRSPSPTTTWRRSRSKLDDVDVRPGEAATRR